MNILYLGHGGANAQNRIEELQRLGHQVVPEPLYPNLQGIADVCARKWAVHRKNGPWIDRLNRCLISRAHQWRSFDLILLDKALYVRFAAIEEVKAVSGCPAVHFTPDIALRTVGTQKSCIFVRAIPSYDAVITTKDFEIEDYWRMGAKSVVFSDQSVSHRRFFPRSNLDTDVLSEIGFIGRCERHYASTFRYLCKRGLPLDVRGPGWEKVTRRLDPRNRFFNKGGEVRGEQYPRRISGMKIGLGLLTKRLGPEVVTSRSLEIPACGTFMLAERTDKHLELFEEGVHAEFFASREELVEKARFYLANDHKRRTIAARGRQRFLDSSCRVDQQVAFIMSRLTERLGLPN